MPGASMDDKFFPRSGASNLPIVAPSLAAFDAASAARCAALSKADVSTLTEDKASALLLIACAVASAAPSPAFNAFLTASLSTTFKADCAASKVALLEAATASLVWAPSLLDESKKLLEALAAASAALDEASSSFKLSAASEKENAARAVDLLWIGALWFGAWRAVAASGSNARSRMATSRDVSNA